MNITHTRPSAFLSLPAITLALLAAGCATPSTQRVGIGDAELEAEERLQLRAAYESQLDHERRLWRIGAQLRRAATDFCPDRKVRELGFSLKDLESVEEDFRDIAGEFGIKEHPVVQVVLNDSSAARSGIMTGDEVLALDDISFEGENAIVLADMNPERLFRATEDGRVTVKVVRDGTPHTFAVDTEEYCNYPMQLHNEDELNAFADGESVHLTRRMMSFAVEDTELAFIVSHELAHNVMEHVDAKTTNAIGGLVVDVAIAVATGGIWPGGFSSAAMNMYSHEFEAEADYVGLYLMAIAGMEIDGAADFWRRIAVETGKLGKKSVTHPSTPERFLAMNKVVEEIKAKIESGEELKPNLDEG